MSYRTNYVFQKKTHIRIKVFNMITNQNEAKTIKKHISCDYKCKFSCTTYNSNQEWNNEICQSECKKYRQCKKDYCWNPSTFVFDNSKYLKSIADTLVILACDEVIDVMDIVSTKMANTIATSTVSINSHGKKLRRKTDCYNLNTVLLVIILLLIIIIICYYDA